MITLSLDEFGEFERGNESDSPMGVAGILYDDHGDEQDAANERDRIKKYYEMCIDESRIQHVKGNGRFEKAFVFPSALHSDSDKIRNTEVVKPVKSTVYKSLGEFLLKGTFRGNDISGVARKGCYYVFGILKSDIGKSRIIGENSSYMVRDDAGSNLYYHMASQVVNRIIFHNPIIPNIDEISLNIATRRTANIKRYSEEAENYRRLGYHENTIRSKNNENSDLVWFSVANADIYRSVISEEMMRSGKQTMTIRDYVVKSIDYSNNNGMEFLYLADSVCSFLSYRLAGEKAEEWLVSLDDKATNLSNDRKMIFAYDEIDIYFQNAWEAYESGDYFGALTRSFYALQEKSGFCDYYKRWFDVITQRISGSQDEYNYSLAVNKLAQTIKTNTYDQSCMLYVFKVLANMVSGLESVFDDYESKKVFYQLLSVGVSVYCHIGDSKNALRYFEECKKYAYSIGVEEFITLLNRMVAALLDSFEWDTAVKISEEVITYQTALLDMRNNLPLSDTHRLSSSMELAKAYSQMGQVLSFIGSNEAEDYFLRALNSLDKSSVNYKITESYLLHYYINAGERENYLKHVSEYFGGNDRLNDRFNYLLDEAFKETPIINYKYALFVFVKGLFVFELDQASDLLLDKLYNIEEVIKNCKKKTGGNSIVIHPDFYGHPLELMYKYLALIAYAKSDYGRSKELLACIDHSVPDKGPTIEVINLFSKADYYNHTQEKGLRDIYTNELMKYIAERFDSLSERIEEKSNMSGDEKYEFLTKFFTYMYS